MAKSNAQRKADLTEAAATYRRRTKAKLTLDDCANLYGLTKPAFVNVRKGMPGFPDPCDRDGNTYFYPAYPAIKAMLDYVERKEKASKDQQSQFARLVTPPREESEDGPEPLSANEQLKAYDLRQRIIDEEIAHGGLHRSADCSKVATRVFSLISRTFGAGFADTLDPMGKWPAAVRAEVDKAGEGVTLRTYAEMKHMLEGKPAGASTDVDDETAGSPRSPKPRRGSGGRQKARKS